MKRYISSPFLVLMIGSFLVVTFMFQRGNASLATCFAVLAFWITAYLLLVFNPFPIPDTGHATYRVANRNAALLIADIIEQYIGVKKRYIFHAGPTSQLLMQDGTVFIWFRVDTGLGFFDWSKARVRASEMYGQGPSFISSHPKRAADNIRAALGKTEFGPGVLTIPAGMSKDTNHPDLVVITNDLFLGWDLVVRRHAFKMPRPEIEHI